MNEHKGVFGVTFTRRVKPQIKVHYLRYWTGSFQFSLGVSWKGIKGKYFFPKIFSCCDTLLQADITRHSQNGPRTGDYIRCQGNLPERPFTHFTFKLMEQNIFPMKNLLETKMWSKAIVRRSCPGSGEERGPIRPSPPPPCQCRFSRGGGVSCAGHRAAVGSSCRHRSLPL